MSIGLGGGSIVRQQQDGSVTVGPDSVGYKITDEALTFGGNIITATDIAVRLGLSEVGDPQLTKQIPLKFAQAALQTISDMIAVATVSYTHLTLPTTRLVCRSRWSPYH